VKPVIFHREAESEFRAAITYFEDQREGLGIQFQEEVAQATAQIARLPRAFAPYGNEGLRRFSLKRFPFSIYYLELDNCIWVAAVAHQRRRPGYWASRSPSE
jgi:toxin ParE1/3/4